MSLAERHKAGPPATSGRCSIGALLRALPEDEATALQGMLDDSREWPADAVYDSLRDEGHVVGRQTIGRHRRNQCSCT